MADELKVNRAGMGVGSGSASGASWANRCM